MLTRTALVVAVTSTLGLGCSTALAASGARMSQERANYLAWTWATSTYDLSAKPLAGCRPYGSRQSPDVKVSRKLRRWSCDWAGERETPDGALTEICDGKVIITAVGTRGWKPKVAQRAACEPWRS